MYFSLELLPCRPPVEAEDRFFFLVFFVLIIFQAPHWVYWLRHPAVRHQGIWTPIFESRGASTRTDGRSYSLRNFLLDCFPPVT